ncbi:AraC family transcriptional regulator [Promicromonospora vindobonensis]|uniref:AraC family transcriptional regulator n=1 Tax=Promicromonospora vindobonensis TaxID=195748 RepID=A0ABW5VR39_9MICO
MPPAAAAPDPHGPVESRTLPTYVAGAVDVPWVIKGMDELVARDTVWETHAHPTHELLWNLRGASSATTDTRTWTITPTLGLWVPAGVAHSGRVPAGTWYRAAQFSTHAVSPLSSGPVAVEITPLLALLLDRLADRDLGSSSRSLTEQMVLDVLAPSPHELFVQQPRSDLLRPIAAALTANPADPRTLSAWAEQLGVSPRTVTRAFRAETGLSFARWQAVLRAQQAVLLLAKGVGVERTAESVGYRSASAFGVAFRRTTGRTPGQFRPA